MNAQLEALNSILSKSPLIIRKEEFKYATEVILSMKLKNQIMPLLRMQEYYLYFDLPFIVKQNLDLLASMDDERLNFFQLIGYVYFKQGSQKEFFANIVLFKFQNIGRMLKSSKYILHKVIGEIIAPLWWQYELFKTNALQRYPESVYELREIIQNLQRQNNNDIPNYQNLPKEFRLIVSNSFINNYQQDVLEKQTDEFIATLLKKDEISYAEIMNYIDYTELVSTQRRILYNKLLFYFWISGKAVQIQQSTYKPQNFNSLLSSSMISIKESKSVQVSRIKTSQLLQSSIIKSQISPSSKIITNLSSSQIKIIKPSNLLLKYLQLNIFDFKEELEDSDLENCFYSFQEKQIEFLDQICSITFDDNQDIAVVSGNELFLNILQDINIETLVNFLDSNYEKRIPFRLIMQQTNNFVNNLNYVCEISEQYRYYEFPTLFSKFLLIYDYIIKKPKLEQKEILRIYGWQNQMTKSEQNTIFRCLQLPITQQVPISNHADIIEVALRLKSIRSYQECLAQQNWLAQIQLDDWSLLRGIVHQIILIQIFNVILQLCLDDESRIGLWQNILKKLCQIINLQLTNEIVIHFFSFVVLNFDLQIFLSLMNIHQFASLDSEQCYQLYDFLNKVLLVEEKSTKLLLLKCIKLLFAYSESLNIDFLIINIDENSKCLILYYQLKICQEYNLQDELNEKALELYKTDDKFYKMFISPDDIPDYDLSFDTDLQASKEQAILYCSMLKSLIQLPEKESFKVEIQKNLNQIKGTSKQILKELDIYFYSSQTKQITEQEIFEFTSNQVQYVEKFVDQRIQQTQFKINQKIKFFQTIQQQYYQYHSNIQYMNQQAQTEQRSKQYFLPQVQNQIEPNTLIFQLVDEFIKSKNIQGKDLIKQEFQNIFIYQKLDITSFLNKPESKIQDPSLYDQVIQQYDKQQLDGKIYFLKAFLEQLEEESNNFIVELKAYQNEINDMNLEDQIKDIRQLLIGCLEACPFCRRKCDQDITRNHKHKCALGHQIRSLGGIIINGKPSLMTCDELQDDQNVYDPATKQIKKWSDWKLKTKKWSFQKGVELNLEVHLSKQISFWNDKIGKYICNRLNMIFQSKYHDNLQLPHHYIFVIDESGSMGGQKWKNIVEATKICLQELLSSKENKITIILFSDDARFVVGLYEPVEIQIEEQIKCLQMQSGGTNFETPFSLILYTILRSQHLFDLQTILFYTDGDADYPTKSMEQYLNLPLELRQKIEILICCEGPQSEALRKVSKFFSSKLLSGQILESISTEAVAQIWLSKLSTTY